MKKFILLPALCIATLPLTGCITREQADKRLENGCAAAAELFIDKDYSIKKIKNAKFKTSKEFGSGYREVRLFAVETDGWMDLDNEYKCIFAEEMGFLGMSHRASIYQVNINDQAYGNKDGKIIGDMKTHLKLTEVVDNAMAP